MELDKKKVLKISEYLENNIDCYFPFQIFCIDFDEKDEFFECDCLELDNDYILKNEQMENFILVENLQNLHKDTIQLMAKGFIEKIEKSDTIQRIYNLATEYKKEWKEDLWESSNIEEYGLNEFIGGKAEAYEDCYEILTGKKLTDKFS